MTGLAGRRCLSGIAAVAQFGYSVTIAASCDYVSLGRETYGMGGPLSKIPAIALCRHSEEEWAWLAKAVSRAECAPSPRREGIATCGEGGWARAALLSNAVAAYACRTTFPSHSGLASVAGANYKGMLRHEMRL